MGAQERCIRRRTPAASSRCSRRRKAVTFFAEALIDGLLIGGVYALVAMGLNLMFGVMKLVNFAHGEFLMLGMYLAVGFASLVLPPEFLGIYWQVIPTTLVMSVVGAAFYLLLLRRAATFGETPQILLTMGLSIGMQGAAQVLQGSNYKLIPNPVNGSAFHLGTITIPIATLIAFVVALAITSIMGWMLGRTRFGKSVRAVAENIEMSQALGIDASRVFVLSTMISIGLVGMAGALLVPYQFTSPNVGQSFVVVAFLAIVVAGLGNVLGSFFGGILLGVAQSLAASYLDIELSTATLYIIFLAVLLLRPQGLFTRRARVV